jgi:two-component system, cell cycle sensor histidine kinase and response regulator CckA
MPKLGSGAQVSRPGARTGIRIFTLSFLVTAALALAIVWVLAAYERQATQSALRYQLQDHVTGLHNSVDRALTVSYALAAMVRQGEGEIEDFEAIGGELLPYYPGVAVLALSPDGIIQQTVPFDENRDSIGFNQFEDPLQGHEARLARDSGVLTLAGPLELVQGGLGAVGRLPVFLDTEDDGERKFWGLVNVVMRFPDVLAGVGLERLEEQGVAYELWRIEPGSGARQSIMASAAALTAEPITQAIAMPNGEWQLSAAPENGWVSQPRFVGFTLLGLVFALLVAWALKMLVDLRRYRLHLEDEIGARTQEIRTTQRQLSATLAAIPDLLFEIDAAGICHSYHSPREDLLVYDPNDFIGTPFERWIPDDVAEVVWAAIEEAERAGHSTGLQYALTLEQGERWFELSVTKKLVGDGEMARYLVLARDITARKAADDALRESEARFLQAQKMESVGRLAGGMAHDFNNLLTVIRGSVDIASVRLPADHPVQRELNQIGVAAQRGAELTRQLLTFSRQQILQPQPLDLNAVVEELLQMSRRMLGEDIRIRTRLAPGPLRILGDASQFSQVLLNLFVNARDAMPQGGDLLVETSRVTLAGSADSSPALAPGSYALVQVSDTGVGMTPEVQQRIFEPFFSTKAPGQGSGLGLATVYGLVRQSGGDVLCRSYPGEGTSFQIYLPLLDEHEAQAAEPEAELPQVDASDGPSALPKAERLILVVEDESAIGDLLMRGLEQAGYRVIGAHDAKSARLLLQQMGQVPDLLITDIVMPGQSGPELAAALRREVGDMAVLFTSGYADDAILRNGGLPPDADFLPKPYSLSQMLDRVERLLD